MPCYLGLKSPVNMKISILFVKILAFGRGSFSNFPSFASQETEIEYLIRVYGFVWVSSYLLLYFCSENCFMFRPF